MPDVVAKAMAVITGVLLVFVIGVLYVTSRPPANSRKVVAEFRDAFPMIEGMQLRTYGADSGSVGTIKITNKGLASITLLVDKTIPAPRADATAAIRQADTTGDSYIDYNPGSSAKPLPERDGKPTIACDAPRLTSPCVNTLAAPRLDDLINAFGPPEQAGVKLILQNLSDAVAQRGDDINRAALDLLPALDAANEAVDEVSSQNAALKRLITNMEDVSRQAGSRHEELGRLIESLDTTLQTTARTSRPLDAGIRGLPATEAQLQTTLARLTRTATAARPLAAALVTAAPRLDSVLTKAPSFIDDLEFALDQGRPTLGLTRKLLAAGAPTIEAGPQQVVTGSFDLAPALSNLLKGILGGKDTIKAFFGDDKNGAAETRPEFGYGLGAVLTEPGDIPGYPASWADRNWARFALVLNCQMFSLPVGPACLSNALSARAAKDRLRPAPLPLRSGPVKALVGAAGTTSKDAATGVLGGVRKKLAPAIGALGQAPRGAGHGTDPEHVHDLLDYLLKP